MVTLTTSRHFHFFGLTLTFSRTTQVPVHTYMGEADFIAEQNGN